MKNEVFSEQRAAFNIGAISAFFYEVEELINFEKQNIKMYSSSPIIEDYNLAFRTFYETFDKIVKKHKEIDELLKLDQTKFKASIKY